MPKHYRPAGKKKEGNVAKYATRSQAIKQLQVSLPLFRRLCILKGVSPREPKKKFKGTNQTYYHVKDIAFLRHEPLLETFRDIRVHEKKVKKALSKKNRDLAKRLKSRKPDYTLDRLIRERYPRFVDALGDLDDCLSMVHLFAELPASQQDKIGVERIHNCRRLCHEWQAYIARTHKLRKTFISVKGIYYEAEVEGQKIRWIAPHKLQQVVTDDIDFGIMLIFQEFYETLIGFVNFRLYQSLNVKYPPILDPRLEALAEELYALTRYVSAKSAIGQQSGTADSDSNSTDQKQNESELRLAQLQHQLPSLEHGSLTSLVEDVEDDDDDETKECKSLFKNMKFFLNREVPRESLLFVIPAFGGTVSWQGEGAPFDETDESINYQIVDRPTYSNQVLSREYVQPQWVYDCVNARIILPTEEYMVGRICPPHLSPFVDNDAEGYVPEYAEKIKRLQAAAKNEILPMPGAGTEDLDDPQNLLSEAVMGRAEANEAADRHRRAVELEKEHHEGLRKELQDLQSSNSSSVAVTEDFIQEKKTEDEAEPDAGQVAEDISRMEKIHLSRKRRGLVEAIEIGRKKKKDDTDLLRERKRKIEKSKKSGQ
ncbi:hypothetical protein V2J09_011654 [Rumex salicifolius]